VGVMIVLPLWGFPFTYKQERTGRGRMAARLPLVRPLVIPLVSPWFR
jgi:hypothetical protein